MQELSRVPLLPRGQNQWTFELEPSKFHNCASETFSEISQTLKLCGIQIRPAAVFANVRGTVDMVAIHNWALCIKTLMHSYTQGSTEAVQTLALCNEAIISSGGVNAGEADYTKDMMKKLGDVAFWKIAMRPGRPMAVGHILRAKLASSPYSISASSYIKESDSKSSGSAILFGLTSNPVAVMLTFLAFVRPALLQMLGCTASAPPLLKARSAEAIRKNTGRTKYQRGTVNTLPVGSLQAKTTGNQGSGVLSSMVKANGLIVLDHGQGNVAPGDEVDEVMFDRHL